MAAVQVARSSDISTETRYCCLVEDLLLVGHELKFSKSFASNRLVGKRFELAHYRRAAQMFNNHVEEEKLNFYITFYSFLTL